MDSHAAISEILDYYANRSDKSDQTVIISLLRELQQANGCIPVSLQERAANAAGVPVSIIRTLMKFHSDLKSSDYRHEITVCTGVRCGSQHASSLLALLRQELKPNKDGISEDGSIRLCVQSCFKKCRSAPNVMVDEVLHPAATREDVLAILNQLRPREKE